MRRLLTAGLALALLLAACSGDGGAQVASIDNVAQIDAGADEDAGESTDDGEAILAFAQCMRDNGIDEFEDPDISADGSVEFRFRGQAQASSVDRETMRAAFEACQEHIEGLAFGPGSVDRTEVEDTLYEFASCMRDNGIDMPDPDVTNLAPGQGEGEGGGPFGGALGPDEPDFRAALEGCQDGFDGGFRFGGRGGGGPS